MSWSGRPAANPRNPMDLRHYRSLRGRGEYSEHERQLLAALIEQPAAMALHLEGVRLYHRLNEPERAATHLGRARELHAATGAAAAELRLAEALDHLAHRDLDTAGALLKELTELPLPDLDDALRLEVLVLAATVEAERHHGFRSRRLIDRALEVDPAVDPELSAQALLLLHAQLVEGGSHLDAQETLVRAQQIAATHQLSEVHAQIEARLARLRVDGDDHAEAARLYRSAADRLTQLATGLTPARRKPFLAQPGHARILAAAAAEPVADSATPLPAPGQRAATSNRLVATLSEISALMNSMSDLDAMLERVMDIAIGIVGAERGLVVLFEPDPEHPSVRVARDLDGDSVAASTEFSRNVLREVAQGREVVTFNTADDAWLSQHESVSLYSIRSLVCFPLRIRDRILGAVYLDNQQQARMYGAEDLEFLRAFTNLAAIAIENSRLLGRLQEENVYLQRVASDRFSSAGIIGTAPVMQPVFRLVEKAMDSAFPVLVTGETGTGKEIVTKAIHFGSARKDKPFIAQNCAAIPSELLESEMFGHRRGAFTGAHQDKKGLFESATGGTLFLDEIGELDIGLQAKLLRVLQDGKIRRVGENNERQVDVRIVSATNQNLKTLVDQGRFRLDLYYRLNVIHIDLPPLRERPEDVPLLAQMFLDRTGRELGREFRGLTRRAIDRLREYSWPGNVRELANVISRAVVFADGDVIDVDSLPVFDEVSALHTTGSRPDDGPANQAASLFQQMRDDGGDFWDVVKRPFLKRDISREVVKDVVRTALEHSGWKYTRALGTLNLPQQEYRRFMNFLAKFDLKVPRPK